MATLAMLSYTSATPSEAPANTDVQDPKSDPPSVNNDVDEMSSPIDILKSHDDYDNDYHYKKKCFYW
ncbi:hypothetical protein BG005_005812, partial [Podila minutissima]